MIFPYDRYALTLLAVAVLTSAPADAALPEPLPTGEQVRYEIWLQENELPPLDFVLSLFQDHDVVFLGEQHKIRHDLELVQALIPRLHEAGVRTLVTEFGRREEQPMIDALLAGSAWDEALAREILFLQFPVWGFQEYLDVYRAAWETSRDRKDEGGFRMIGMNDSPDWTALETDADRSDPEKIRKVWAGMGEDRWAEAILEPVRAGEKVLVHCGIHHAFTGYRQPIVANGEFRNFDPNPRAGNHVRAELGDRTVTVYLHAPWNGAEGYGAPLGYPADGVIDAVMLAREGGPRPAGFRLSGSPFADVAPRDGVYRHGYEDFRLADFCDGWIYTKPLSEYEGVTAIPDWITEENLEAARRGTTRPSARSLNAAAYNMGIFMDAAWVHRWTSRFK